LTLKPVQLLHHKRYMAAVEPCNEPSTSTVSFKFLNFSFDTALQFNELIFPTNFACGLFRTGGSDIFVSLYSYPSKNSAPCRNGPFLNSEVELVLSS